MQESKMKDLAENVIHNIFDDLTDRSGFGGWWDSIDQDIQDEIRETLTNIVLEELKRDASLKSQSQ